MGCRDSMIAAPLTGCGIGLIPKSVINTAPPTVDQPSCPNQKTVQARGIGPGEWSPGARGQGYCPACRGGDGSSRYRSVEPAKSISCICRRIFRLPLLTPGAGRLERSLILMDAPPPDQFYRRAKAAGKREIMTSRMSLRLSKDASILVAVVNDRLYIEGGEIVVAGEENPRPGKQIASFFSCCLY